MRIISLLPSTTEIVCALGCQHHLVGRSHECDYPDAVRTLPVCSEPKFNPEGNSRQIDREVKTIVRESLSVYRVKTDRLKALRPDLILTQDHCKVCAVSLADVRNAVATLVESKPQIVAVEPERLASAWKGFSDIAAALGHPEKGDDLIQHCQHRMAEISKQARDLAQTPLVALIEWLDPLMSAGNWMPEFVDMLGGTNLFGEAGKRSPWIAWEDLRQKNPDLIVLMPCGWDIERTRKDLYVLTSKRGWRDLKAVRQGRVYLTDGNQYFNRPGPRLVASYEILAELMYPNHFQFGHEDTGWQRAD